MLTVYVGAGESTPHAEITRWYTYVIGLAHTGTDLSRDRICRGNKVIVWEHDKGFCRGSILILVACDASAPCKGMDR